MSRQLQKLSAALLIVCALQASAADVRGKVKLADPADAAGTLVFLETVPGTFEPPKEPVHLSQRGARFSPPILAVLKGTTVDFTNDDWISHNVFARSERGPDAPLPELLNEFDTGVYAATERHRITFSAGGRFELYCSIHPTMRGALYVFEHPFFVTPGEDGSFSMKEVPLGKYELSVRWRDGRQTHTPVTVPAKGTVTVKTLR